MNDIRFGEAVRLVNLVSRLADGIPLSFSETIDRLEHAPATLLSAEKSKTDLRAVARTLLRARASRSESLGIEIFRDPAWDMLLDLYGNIEPGEGTMISTLCQAAGVPPTTALRYVHKLVESGLLLSRDDPDDHRRTMVRLAPGTAERIERLLAMIDCRS